MKGVAQTEIVEQTDTGCKFAFYSDFAIHLVCPENAHVNVWDKLIYAISRITGYCIGEVPEKIIMDIMVTNTQFIGFHSLEYCRHSNPMPGFLDIFRQRTALKTEAHAKGGRKPLADSEIIPAFHLAVEKGLGIFRKHRDATACRDKEIIPQGIDLVFLFLRTGKCGR